MENSFSTIMFADVSGSSKLFKTVGDIKAREIISKAVSMMMTKTTENSGRVIKTIGDEVMAAFPEPNNAVYAAIAIQNNITSINYGAPITIRIGLHTGRVIEEDGDVYGEAVNDAAAIVKEAKGSQILTSVVTTQELPASLQEKCQHFDHIRLKGGKDRDEIQIIQWQDQSADTDSTIVRAAITPEMIKAFNANKSLKLSYLGETYQISEKNTPFTIGRGVNNDIQLQCLMASREHCTINFHRGKFVLLEKSTNGTHIKSENAESIYIRREETVLAGKGSICFSSEGQPQQEDIIHYQC